MNQEYVEKWTDFAKQFQGPLQSLAELNVKTLQSFSYIKPEEWSNIKKPEELVKKQIKIIVDNGHLALDHLQKSFQIMEKAVLSAVDKVKETTETH